jgi:prolyl 4-hydroxylase
MLRRTSVDMQQSPPDIETLRRDAQAGHPGACYNLGVWLLTGEGGQPDPEGARVQFEKGAASQHAPSESALGYLLLRGHGGAADTAAAYGLFDRAARRGFQEAIFRRGELRAAGVGTPLDLESARQDFAAAVDHPLAQLHLAYCLEQGLGGARDPAAATALVVVAARSGDPAGLLALGRRLEHGHTLPANVCAARWCYEEAARRGCPLADQRTADLDCRMPPAPPDLNKLTAPSNDLDRPRRGPSVEVLSWQPRVFFFRGFMDLEERSHLIRMAAPLLQPSAVIQRGSGANVRSAGRRSGVARLIAPLKDVVIAHVERRIAQAARLPVENGEPLAVLHYGPGDEYRRHHDYFDPAIPGRERPLARGGQRIATFMAYLSAVEAGGATRFPEADLRIRAEPGSAILFYNTLPDGSLDPASLHAGEPVAQGEKWVATRWLRERPYTGPI